jgi:hypothetical protein
MCLVMCYLQVLPPVPKIEIQLEPHHQTLPVGTVTAVSLIRWAFHLDLLFHCLERKHMQSFYVLYLLILWIYTLEFSYHAQKMLLYIYVAKGNSDLLEDKGNALSLCLGPNCLF